MHLFILWKKKSYRLFGQPSNKNGLLLQGYTLRWPTGLCAVPYLLSAGISTVQTIAEPQMKDSHPPTPELCTAQDMTRFPLKMGGVLREPIFFSNQILFTWSIKGTWSDGFFFVSSPVALLVEKLQCQCTCQKFSRKKRKYNDREGRVRVNFQV